LEFPIVIIIGLNEGTLPHSRSFDDPEGMLEERRLFYVGVTRAKDHLILVHAENRSMYGYTEPVEPSRYLADIPESLIETIQPTRSYARNHMRAGASSSGTQPSQVWESKPQKSQPEKLEEQRFSPGAKVLHPTWGNGLVLNSRLQDGDEIVDIFFEEVGLKRVMASVANLSLRE
jgi:DNA helicase-2/ATP-dependent DNA helicase PcrA